jgi:hypothetical protein
MTESWETLLVERNGGVVTVTMNRPERKNAANGTMWGELGTVFDDIAADRDVRAMVLTGAGGAFCSGADVSDPSHVGGRPGDPYLVQMRALGELALRLHTIPRPTIAKVGGVAAGAGMSLALGRDLVVASVSARFSRIFAKRGLSIDMGSSWLLPRLMACTGRRSWPCAVSQDGVNEHHVAVVDEDVGGRGDRVDLGQPLAIGKRNAVRPVGQPRHDRVDGDHGRDPCRCGQPCFTLALHLVLNQTAENYAQCQGQHEAQDAERDGEGNEAPVGS